VIFLTLFFFFLCIIGITQALDVNQPFSVFSQTGQKAVVRCNHSIVSYNSMYWYLQRSNGAPELLIYGYDKAEPKGRFSMEFDRAGRVTELHISDTQLEDAVMYYCAVQPTVVKSMNISVQKHRGAVHPKTMTRKMQKRNSSMWPKLS
ncbi:LV223 protein, partial [Atractosteus spatula]|nr:LV223 protein [Atractosteus spatula]